MPDPRGMVAGFNHNVKYGGKSYHVQTEDSGVGNPRIVTHLFLGGNILATKRTAYDEITGAADLDRIVREIMEEQHKEMLRGLVAGVFDEILAEPPRPTPAAASPAAPPPPPSRPAPEQAARSAPEAGAAPARPAQPPGPPPRPTPPPGAPRIGALPTPVPTAAEPVPLALDDVILSYLAEDLGPKKE